MKIAVLVFTVTFLLISIQLIGENYFEGELNIKVQTPFATIYINNGIIVTEQNWFNDLSEEYQIDELEQIIQSDNPPHNQWFHLEFPENFEVNDVKNDFEYRAEVLIAEPSFIYQLFEVPDDELYSFQWALTNIQAEDAWDIETGSEEIIVGVIDTGIDLGDPDEIPIPSFDDYHPDLDNNILKDENNNVIGRNFRDPDFPSTPFDENGHGTHVSGIISAVTNNEIGVAGLAGGWNQSGGVKLMPVKIFPRDGGASPSILAQSITWAANNGSDIINMSLGAPEYSQLVYDEILYAASLGITLIAAAGNSYAEAPNYPAYHDEVIGVVSTNELDEKSVYSTYGYWTDISAPGGFNWYPCNDPLNILSTTPHYPNFHFHADFDPDDDAYVEMNYGYMAGTSMAAPYVSGLAALIKSHFPGITNDEIREKILGTADDIYSYNLDYIGKLGAGRINAFRALTENEHPSLRIHSYVIDDGNNGFLECNETANFEVNLKNWWINAENVIGILSEEDEEIEISNNQLIFGNIDQGTISSQNNTIIITETSLLTNPRTVTFNLELTANNMQDVILHFNVKIHPNSSNPFISLPLQTGETFTTHLVEADTDNDNYSEILVGTSFGNLFLCKYDGTFISFAANNAIYCTPAVADINNNGYKGIITGDDSGIVNVWDHNGNLLSSFDLLYKCVESIVVEDVTGDGQLEIIVLTLDQQEQDMYLNVINPTNSEQTTFDLGTDFIEFFITPLSVADVNDDIEKEIIVILKPVNNNCILKVFSVNSDFNIIETFNYDYGDTASQTISGPIIADLDEDGINEIISLFRNNGFTSLVAFHFELMEPYFENNSLSNETYIQEQICIGNIRTDLPGLEIFVENIREHFLFDCGGNIISEFSMNYQIHKLRSVININSDLEQELLYITPTYFLVYDNEGNEITEWNIMGNFHDLTTASFSEQSNMAIILLKNNGSLYKFPFSFSEQSTSEWSQYQNNSRNTGCYYQPLPEEVNDNITLKHDTVIGKNTKILPGNTLTIEEGIEIRFEKNKSLNFTGISESPSPGGLICIGIEEDSIRFGGLCSYETKNYWNGIFFNKMRTSEIEHSIIQNAYTGLSYYDGESHILNGNRISNNDVGLSFYNSSFCVNVNEIIDNNYGVSCDKYASPFFGYPGITTPDIGHNGIMYNDIAVCINRATPSFEDGFNDICDNFNLNMLVKEIEEIQINAQRNWWGSNNEQQIIRLLDPYWFVDYDPWCDSPQTIFGNRGDSLTIFQQACVKLYEEQYNEAIVLFQQVIEDSLETIEDQISVASLYKCYSILESIFELGNYIDDRLGFQPSEVMEKCFKNYKALVNRALSNYNDAIVYYEDILLNNPSYVDSCYAVIDIGNTYLESNGRASGRLMHLQPESFEGHLCTTQLLLESIRTGNHIKNNIPQVKKCVLYKNYPNPFNPETKIVFSIPEDSKVNLSIYNIKGQKVKTLIKDQREKGFHEIIWNSKNNNGKSVASGIYFYKFDVNGKTKGVKKMLLLK